MKIIVIMKHILYFAVVAIALMFVACGEREITPDVPDTPQEEPNQDPDPQPEPKPYPQGTYHFSDGVQGSIYTMEASGLRNDYLSFYDNATGHTLFIDFYCDPSNAYLATGDYVLGDGSAMTCHQEYSYVLFAGSEELFRFSEGGASVFVNPEHESGYPWYQITGYFEMLSGESVSLSFEGQLLEM